GSRGSACRPSGSRVIRERRGGRRCVQPPAAPGAFCTARPGSKGLPALVERGALMYSRGPIDHRFDLIRGRFEEDAMPKRKGAPKKGAMKSRAGGARGARGAGRAAAGEEGAGREEMLDIDPEAGAGKPTASGKPRRTRKLAVVPKPAVEDEDSTLDLDLDMDDEAPAR